MIFTATTLKGVFLIDPEPVRDERGMFMRTWCQREFEAHRLPITWVQSSSSVNIQRGTMRGLHYQSAPHEEVKWFVARREPSMMSLSTYDLLLRRTFEDKNSALDRQILISAHG